MFKIYIRRVAFDTDTTPSFYRFVRVKSQLRGSLILLLLFAFSSYSKCDDFIRDFKEGKLQTQPGCSADDTLEVSG